MRLFSFHGGLALAGHREVSAGSGVQPCALPDRLQLLMDQHAGHPALPCVRIGDRVWRGQRVALAQGEPSADIHSPCAGTVESVGPAESPRHPGRLVHAVVIRVESEDGSPGLVPMEWTQATPDALRARIREAGVVGLGGAGYSTADKLAIELPLLVLNGVECEPWLTCDDALLREHADEIVLGGQVMARAVGAGRVVLALQDAMVKALSAAGEAAARLGQGAVEVVAVPSRYPQGGERQLLQTLLGREVPRGGLTRSLGALVHNVATARAAWRAVALGEPLLERVVTVSGGGVARPGNYLVALGTPVSHLIAQAGGYRDGAARLLLGGPMMGQALAHDALPLGKLDGAVLVLDASELPAVTTEQPCIRCGACADVCPSRLLPQQLLWHARGDQPQQGEAQGLFDCIECGACDLACPSLIPLTATFVAAKRGLREQASGRERALAARQRFQSRQQRLERLATQRTQRHQERKAEAASPDAVAAALARARAKRAGSTEPGTPP